MELVQLLDQGVSCGFTLTCQDADLIVNPTNCFLNRGDISQAIFLYRLANSINDGLGVSHIGRCFYKPGSKQSIGNLTLDGGSLTVSFS